MILIFAINESINNVYEQGSVFIHFKSSWRQTASTQTHHARISL